MSTIIMICLAIAVILWRPPFRVPRPSKKSITPILIIIILSSLLLLGSFKSTSEDACCQQASACAESSEAILNQSSF